MNAAATLPVQLHSIKGGRLGHGGGDGTCLHLILLAVELVHTVQDVVPQDHAYVVLVGLQDAGGVSAKTILAGNHSHIVRHSRLCCRGTARTCFLCFWSVCVCVFHLPCLGASAATGPWMCRPSDHPDSWEDAAPRDHCLWTSLGSRSGEIGGRGGLQLGEETGAVWHRFPDYYGRRTLLAASRACSISSLIFLMFSVMLLRGENCDVRFSTSEILLLRDGMVFSKSFTAREWQDMTGKLAVPYFKRAKINVQ